MTDDGLPAGLWAWMTRVADGEWVLVGVMAQGLHTPLVFASRRLATHSAIRALAQGHADGTGQLVRLVRFKGEAILETL